MTDQEVICAWMEPQPLLSEGAMQEARQPYPYWWTVHDEIAGEWQPRILALDALREVEARLTYAQWSDYSHGLGFASFGEPVVRAKLLIHASAEQKIEALAAILRNNAHAKGAPDA